MFDQVICYHKDTLILFVKEYIYNYQFYFGIDLGILSQDLL